ncbi:Ldh family oxidoreductase [Candidatus Poribacteria bacterium]
MTKLSYEKLNCFISAILEKLAVPSEDAQVVADVLVQASLRGVDTHGVDLLPSYVQRTQSGMSNPSPEMKIVKESPAMAVIDADQALGPVSSVFGMKLAIQKALSANVGWVNVVNSSHHGALAYYPMMAAKQDMIGIVTTTTSPCMAPWGSRQRLVGNTPIAIAVPRHDNSPVVLDMACSFLANGRVRLAKEKEEPLPDGLSIDAQGEPTCDPECSVAVLPFGNYKGSGMAMMFGFLAGTLAGAPFTAYRKGFEGGVPSEISHLLIAVNISSFSDLEEFKLTVDETIKAWNESETRSGFDEVLVPGEIEWRCSVERSQNGIPLHAALETKLRKIAHELGLEFPATV